MKRDLIRIGIVVGVFVLIAGAWFLLDGDGAGAAEGQQAPQFSLEVYDPSLAGSDGGDGEDGNRPEVSLADLRGQPVFLNLWATWCEPCRWEMPFVRQIQEEHSNVQVYAINIGEPESKVQAFLEEEGLTGLNILLDKEFDVYEEYEVTGLPISLFLNEDGVICTRYGGAMTLEMMEAALASTAGEC